MKKGIVFGLLILAVIVLVSPGVVGKMAEGYVEQGNEWTSQSVDSSGVRFTQESYESGWFTSQSVDRLSISDATIQAELVEALELTSADQLPELLIYTRLDHGLIPVSSLSRDGGSLAPALARTVSTVSVVGADGGRIDVPTEFYGHIGLGGTIYSDITIEAGSTTNTAFVAGLKESAATLGLDGKLADELNDASAKAGNEEVAISWEDISMEVSLEPNSGRVTFVGGGDGMSVDADDGFVKMGAFRFMNDSTPTAAGVPVGDYDFEIDSFQVNEPESPPMSFGPISIKGSSSADGDRINADSQMFFAASEFPGVGSASMTMDVALSNLDAEPLKRLSDALNSMQDGVTEQEMFVMLEPDLRELLSSGLGVEFRQLDVELPQGTINSKISVTLPETDAASFSWAGVLQAMSGSANLSVPGEMVDMALAMNPQAQMVVGMGFLQKNGEVYEMEALYEKGLLTVNGAPIPIPMPMQ
ncbi:MAG: DUF945 family protein [Woeseiaceae bacterium]|nr:DUF945 family protein [Woeseiaceae bacterium]